MRDQMATVTPDGEADPGSISRNAWSARGNFRRWAPGLILSLSKDAQGRGPGATATHG
jgi:hypothetical protein